MCSHSESISLDPVQTVVLKDVHFREDFSWKYFSKNTNIVGNGNLNLRKLTCFYFSAMRDKYVDARQCSIQHVKLSLQTLCFFNDSLIFCAVHSCCQSRVSQLNKYVFGYIFMTMVSIKRSAVICLWCNFVFI